MLGVRGCKRGITLRIFTFSFVTFLASSCGKIPDFNASTITSGVISNPDESANSNIDILFVIDNSGSMSSYQNMLSNAFEDFIENFTEKGLKYHIGVISTDTCPFIATSSCTSNHWNSYRPNNSGNQFMYGGIFNNGVGGLLSHYDIENRYFPDGDALLAASEVAAPSKYLTWELGDAETISRFKNNARVSISGSASEAPLTALSAFIQRSDYLHITDNPIDVNYNNGFFRAGAFTAIFLITDADESYGFVGNTFGGSANAFVRDNSTHKNSRINTFLSAIEQQKGANLDNFVMSVIADEPDSSDCTGFEAGEAVTLFDTVDKINNDYGTLGSGKAKARFIDICSILNATDLSSQLTQVAQEVVEANARYFLGEEPDLDELFEVYVDGSLVSPCSTPLAPSPTNCWSYDSNDNAIQFYLGAIPGVGESVDISYTPED